MTWVKLDDGFYDNLTNRALGPAGRDLFIASLCFCAKANTDGKIPKADVDLVLAQAQTKSTTVTKLIAAGRWLDRGDHYEVDQYLRYNPSRQQTEDRRSDISRKKSEAGKKGARARWHSDDTTDGKRNGTADSTAIAPGDGKRDGPVPSRPHQSPPHTPPAGADPSHIEEDLTAACRLVAHRKLDLRRQRSEKDPNDTDAWLAKVTDTDRDRLRTEFEQLYAEHRDWTIEQLADRLDPDTAPIHPSHAGLEDAANEQIQRHNEAAKRAQDEPISAIAFDAARDAIRH